MHRDFFFLFISVRMFVQTKHCYEFSVSGQAARTWLWVIATAEAFYVSQFSSQWKSTCFYKSSPLRNTCTEQQAHCFPFSHIVKIERPERQHQAGLLNHSSFLAPLGWLESSCQKQESCNSLVSSQWINTFIFMVTRALCTVSPIESHFKWGYN